MSFAQLYFNRLRRDPFRTCAWMAFLLITLFLFFKISLDLSGFKANILGKAVNSKYWANLHSVLLLFFDFSFLVFLWPVNASLLEKNDKIQLLYDLTWVAAIGSLAYKTTDAVQVPLIPLAFGMMVVTAFFYSFYRFLFCEKHLSHIELFATWLVVTVFSAVVTLLAFKLYVPESGARLLITQDFYTRTLIYFMVMNVIISLWVVLAQFRLVRPSLGTAPQRKTTV